MLRIIFFLLRGAQIVRKGRTLVDEEGRIGEQMEGFDGNSGGAIVVHLVGDQGKGEADAVTEAYEAAYEAALAAMQLSEADIPRPNHNQPRFQLGNRQREAEEAEGLQHQLHQYMGQRVGENNNQNQNQRQVRVRVIRIDVKLVLKLAVGVFLLSQGGSRTRVLLLSLLAGVAYLAQAGHVANGAFPRALETAKEAAVQRLVRSARGARRGHPAAEAECFLIGFCCSLFPGFRLPPAATQDAGDDDDDDAFRRD